MKNDEANQIKEKKKWPLVNTYKIIFRMFYIRKIKFKKVNLLLHEVIPEKNKMKSTTLQKKQPSKLSILVEQLEKMKDIQKLLTQGSIELQKSFSDVANGMKNLIFGA